VTIFPVCVFSITVYISQITFQVSWFLIFLALCGRMINIITMAFFPKLLRANYTHCNCDVLQLEAIRRRPSHSELSLRGPRCTNLQIQQLRNLCGPIWHPRAKFQRNRAMHGWVIDDLANFSGPFFGGRNRSPIISETRGPSYTKFDRTKASHRLSPVSFRFQTCCSISKRWRLKGDWGQKSTPNFGCFFTPVKLRGGMGKIFEWIEQVGLYVWYTFAWRR